MMKTDELRRIIDMIIKEDHGDVFLRQIFTHIHKVINECTEERGILLGMEIVGLDSEDRIGRLRVMIRRLDGSVEVIEGVSLYGIIRQIENGRRIARIRWALIRGDVETANSLLGELDHYQLAFGLENQFPWLLNSMQDDQQDAFIEHMKAFRFKEKHHEVQRDPIDGKRDPNDEGESRDAEVVMVGDEVVHPAEESAGVYRADVEPDRDTARRTADIDEDNQGLGRDEDDWVFND